MIHYEEIAVEVCSATNKFPGWPTDPLHALAVLGEEFGELTQAMLQMVYEPHRVSRQQVRREAIQTAAMCVRLLQSLDDGHYRWNRCLQCGQITVEVIP